MPIKKPSLSDLVFYFVIALVVAGFAYWLIVQSQENRAQQALEEQQTRVELTHMTMPQAVAHCHNLWKAWHFDQPALAVAWHRQSVDWYVLEGVDTSSMRHFACDGNVANPGARYERVLGKQVPPQSDETRNILNDRKLFDYLVAMEDPGLAGIEVTENPATRQLVERRWSKPGIATNAKDSIKPTDNTTNAEAGRVQLIGPDARDIPVLFRTPPAELAVAQFPALKALPNVTNWLLQPDRVFAMLESQLPPDARIAEIDFDDKIIKVTIVGPIKNFDNKPPAEFGDTRIDEYGIRDHAWWYPREQVGFSCTPGHRLREVATMYAESSNAKNPKLLNASFSCRGRSKVTSAGSWALRVPRRSSN